MNIGFVYSANEPLNGPFLLRDKIISSYTVMFLTYNYVYAAAAVDVPFLKKH
jgi:hypothetical protein